MSDLIEDIAEEEEEEEEGGGEKPSGDGGEARPLDSSDEEDDGVNEYEDDGFVVNELEEEEEEEAIEDPSAKKEKRKKNKRRRRSRVLDKEDYELLEDNNPEYRGKSNKRLKKKTEKIQGRTSVAQLADQLFGPSGLEDDVGDMGLEAEAAARLAGDQQGYELDDDDDDGFIVEDDAVRARRQAQKRRQLGLDAATAEALNDASEIFGDVDRVLQEYYQKKHEAEQWEQHGQFEEEEEVVEDEDGGDDGTMLHGNRHRERVVSRAKDLVDPEVMAKLYLLPEDEQIRCCDIPERYLLRNRQLITNPEQFEVDEEACAEWVWSELFGPAAPERLEKSILRQGILEVQGSPADGRQRWDPEELVSGNPELADLKSFRAMRKPRSEATMEAWDADDEEQRRLQDSIAAVLKLMHGSFLEVPVIAMHRKERCGELLCMRAEDQPLVTTQQEVAERQEKLPHMPEGTIQPHHRRIRRWDLLWGVWEQSLRWLQLQKRKDTRRSGYEQTRAQILDAVKMLKEQEERLRKQLEEPPQSGLEESMQASTAAEQADEVKWKVLEMENKLATVESCLDGLDTARSMDDLSDLEAKYRLFIGRSAWLEDLLRGLSLVRDGAAKRPVRSNKYQLCCNANLGSMIGPLLLTPGQLAENLSRDYKEYEPQDRPPAELFPHMAAILDASSEQEPLLQIGSLFVNAQQLQQGSFPLTAADAVSAAKDMGAIELASEPALRAHVRRLFMQNAVVTTDPTDSGKSLLDPFHVYGSVKRLHSKPVQTFAGTDLFLRCMQAEKEKLLTVSISVPPDVTAMWLDPADVNSGRLMELYRSDGVSDLATVYNSFRADVLRAAITEHLVPLCAQEARLRLEAEAREVVLGAMSDALWRYATLRPLTVRELAGDSGEEEEGPREMDEDGEGEGDEQLRCMAICWGAEQQCTTAVVLDELGFQKERLLLPQLTGRIMRTRREGTEVHKALLEDERKGRDMTRLRQCIMQHKPHVILVGAGSPECRQLYEDLRLLCDSLQLDEIGWIHQHYPITKHVAVRWEEETLAKLWETSSAALEEMGEQDALVRRAVALGRLQINPLAVLVALAEPSREILSLALHPLQRCVSPDEQMRAVLQTLVTVVNQVGVNINNAAHVNWMAPPLQCVAGLGPRKAAALLRGVQRNNYRLTSRDQLQTNSEEAVKRNVMRNCNPFIIVSPGLNRNLANEDFYNLDRMRIRCELYKRAYWMAQAINSEAEDQDEDNMVREAMESPSDLELLDLASYNARLMEEEQRDLLASLIDIRNELLSPYGDLRSRRRPLTETDLFYLLSGETKETLKEGKIVSGKVRWVGRELARVVLENGLEATVDLENVSRNPRESMDAHLRVQDTLTARILRIIEPTHQHSDGTERDAGMKVQLTSRSDDLENVQAWEERYCRDPYYHIPTAEEINRERDSRKRRAERPSFQSRPIKHPLFRNISMWQAVEELADQDAGACILRPSLKGPSQLSVTVKIHKGAMDSLYLHSEIKEGPKPRGPGANLRLGLPLRMTIMGQAKDEVFEDLDEVNAGYVERLVENVRALTSHRKFQDGAQAEVDEVVRREKQGQVHFAAYRLGLMYDRPGVFFLSVVINRTPHHEYGVITNHGFYFRKRTWDDLDKLLHSFKKQPIPSSRRNQQQQPHPPHPQSGHQHLGAPMPPRPPSMSDVPRHMAYPPPPAAHQPPAHPPPYGPYSSGTGSAGSGYYSQSNYMLGR